MVIKDIDMPIKNFKLLVEEQRVGDILYRISDSYAPTLGNVCSRVSISKINEEDSYNYEETHGLDLSEGKLQSYFIFQDKNRSSHDGAYLDDNFGYYQEIINAFEELINTGKSEFTNKALAVFDNVRLEFNKIGRGKNAI